MKAYDDVAHAFEWATGEIQKTPAELGEKQEFLQGNRGGDHPEIRRAYDQPALFGRPHGEDFALLRELQQALVSPRTDLCVRERVL